MSSDLNAVTSNAMSMFAQAKVSSATGQLSAAAGDSDNAKIKRSASEFESILLASWLESAEKSFATVPGGDDEQDQDSCKGQYQSFGVQVLASAITKAGGLGIGSMIAASLAKTQHSEEGSKGDKK